MKVARAQLLSSIGIAGSATRSGGPGYAGSGAAASGAGTPTRTSSVINSGNARGHRLAGRRPDLSRVRRLIEENAAIAQSGSKRRWPTPLCRNRPCLLATTVIELRIADANIDLQQKNGRRVSETRCCESPRSPGSVAGHHGNSAVSAVITAQGCARDCAQALLIGLGIARAQYAPCHRGARGQKSGGS